MPNSCYNLKVHPIPLLCNEKHVAAMLNEGDKRDLSTAFNKSLGIFYYAKFNTLGFFHFNEIRL